MVAARAVYVVTSRNQEQRISRCLSIDLVGRRS